MSRILALIGLCFIGSVAAQEGTGIIVIAGQSNAVGYDGNATELSPSDLDRQVLFRWRTGDPPVDEFDNFGPDRDSDAFWTTLQPQPRSAPMPKGTIDRQYGNAAYDPFFGVEMSLARTLLKAQSASPLAILKTAWNGTGVGLDWDEDRDCYLTLVEETRAALENDTRDFHLRAFVWIQGESDANPTDAPLYKRRLKEMISRYRTNFEAPDLPVFLGVNTNFGYGKKPPLTQVIEAQKSLAEEDPTITYIETDDATHANGAHFDTAGYLMIGQRIAQLMLESR